METLSIPPLAPPIWVDTPQKLETMINNLQRVEVLAVDTESNSLYAYRERVCLLQFSTAETDYLVDPLVLPDLSALAGIFSDPGVEKVFHAAEYDIICLKRDYGFTFTNIFDTMLAGRILGKNHLGLGSMLEEYFGVRLNKRFQRANWGKRPLPEELLAYARLDTHYLIPLRRHLAVQLELRGLFSLAREDFARLCAVEASPPANSDDLWCRVAGNQELTARQRTILKELCDYREQMAKAADLPPFKVIGNKELLAIALACPQSVEHLEKLRLLSQRQTTRYGEGIIGSIRRGKQARLIRRPCYKPRSENSIARLEALRDWRKRRGRMQGVESDIILPRDILEEIAHANPQKLDDLRLIMQPVPWRFEQYGEEILQALHG